MGGSSLRSQFQLHPFRALTPSPTFRFPPFMPFTIFSFDYSSYLVVLILFLFILSHVLLARSVRAHPSFSEAASSSRFPPFLPTTSTALVYKYPFQISTFHLFYAQKIWISHVLIITYNSLTRSLHRMPNSHDLLPNSPSPPPPHPSLPFSPTTGTVLGFEYPFKILTLHNFPIHSYQCHSWRDYLTIRLKTQQKFLLADS